MSVICSICRKEIPEKQGRALKITAYITCDECHDAFVKKNADKDFASVIDQYETPVLVVDEDCRIVAANKLASQITGAGPSKRDLLGLFGGEAMGCKYADLPEGCGKTEHCVGCAIRKSISATIENNATQKNIPVTIKKEDGEVNVVISTEKIFSLVRINIKADVLPSKG